MCPKKPGSKIHSPCCPHSYSKRSHSRHKITIAPCCLVGLIDTPQLGHRDLLAQTPAFLMDGIAFLTQNQRQLKFSHSLFLIQKTPLPLALAHCVPALLFSLPTVFELFPNTPRKKKPLT